jgi:hypothetical protein
VEPGKQGNGPVFLQRPGRSERRSAKVLSGKTDPISHFVGVSETLALAKQLGLPMPEQVRIFTIEVEDPFTLGTALTPALQAALPGLVARIRAALQSLLCS